MQSFNFNLNLDLVGGVMYRVPWVCSPAYSLHKYILIAYSVPGSVLSACPCISSEVLPRAMQSREALSLSFSRLEFGGLKKLNNLPKDTKKLSIWLEFWTGIQVYLNSSYCLTSMMVPWPVNSDHSVKKFLLTLIKWRIWKSKSFLPVSISRRWGYTQDKCNSR